MNSLKKIFRSRWFLALVIILVLVRAVTPALILKHVNGFLTTFSEIYQGQIEDLDIHFLRGAYVLKGVSVRLKKNPADEFAFVKSVDVSIAWRELFSGRINTDIIIDEAKVVLSKKVTETVSKDKTKSKDESKKAASKLFPVRVGRIDIENSQFEVAELLSIPEAQRWRLTKVSGRISNLTATDTAPISLATARATLFESSEVKMVANLNLLKKVPAWDLDLELRRFYLPNANEWLKRKLPLTFTSGTMDLYSEVRYEDEKLEGYVKPFIRNADIIANRESFLGLKHFAIEVSAATANLILRSARDKVLATKVLFSYEHGEFNINSSKALSDAIKNGFSEPIPEGLDDEISLSKKNMKISKHEVKK